MWPKSRLLGVTGGIGSGKSYVCKLLETRHIPIYYCDDAAKRLIRHHAPLQHALTALVGPELYDEQGRLCKPVLAAYLCRGGTCSQNVDRLVHPCVAADFRQWAAQQTAPWAAMECALLYEARFDRLVDCSLLVAAPLEVRIRRIMERDHLSRAGALQWIGLQMSEEEKRKRADFTIENDGVQPLEPQIETVLGGLSFFEPEAPQGSARKA